MSSPLPPSRTALQAAAGLIASGRAAEAARELNALVRAAPTYAAAYVLLAKAREATGDRVRALDAWHRAYFLVPSSPLVRRERQRLLDTLGPPPARTEETTPAETESANPEPETGPESRDIGAIILPPLAEETDDTPHDAPEAENGTWLFPEDDASTPLPSLDPVKTWGTDELEPEDIPLDPADELPVTTQGLDTDLDALIRDLEDAPRIRPDPNFEGPDVISDEPEAEEIASETLAKIYEAQGQYARAAGVYETLARQKPNRAVEMRERAQEMRLRAAQ